MKRQFFLAAMIAFCLAILWGFSSPAIAKMPNVIQQCLVPSYPMISPQKYIELARLNKGSEEYYYIQVIFKEIQPFQTLIKVKNGQCETLIEQDSSSVSLTSHLSLEDSVRLAEAKWRHALKTPFGVELVNSFAQPGDDYLENGEYLGPLVLPKEDILALQKLGARIHPDVKVLP